MDIKKYRFCLIMVAFMIIMVSIMAYIFFSEENKSYKDGILVQNVYVLEEEPV